MILGDISRSAPADAGTTLDDILRLNAARHPDAIALIDPPNRESFTDGAPRRLTYAQADRIDPVKNHRFLHSRQNGDLNTV